MPTVTTDVSPAVMALAHEARREALHCIARGKCTPSEIAEHTGRPLGVVAYHVRMLRDYGIVEVARTEPRRGALQHFYRFTAEAEGLLSEAVTHAKNGRADAIKGTR